jgi:hypothetical protein
MVIEYDGFGSYDVRDDYRISYLFAKEGFFKPKYFVVMSKVNGWNHDRSERIQIRKKDYKVGKRNKNPETIFKLYRKMGNLLKV